MVLFPQSIAELHPINETTPIAGSSAAEIPLQNPVAHAGSSTYYNTELLGNLTCQSRLVLDANCRVNGSVRGNHIELFGEVFGNVISNDTLILSETAIIHGNVKAKELIAHPSAVIKGVCKITSMVTPYE